MARIERFEDLIAWQKARELTSAIYGVTRQPAFREDFDLVRQVRRAAVSAMSNVAEGFERNRPAEFHQFLSTAKASCGEVRSQLYVALDAGFISNTLFTELYARSTELGRIIGGLRAAVARQKTKDTQNSAPSTEDSRNTQHSAPRTQDSRNTQHAAPSTQDARNTQDSALSTQDSV